MRGNLGKGFLSVVGGFAFVLALAGCENRYVNDYNYERIVVGMPMEQVEDLVGKPSRHVGDEFFYEGEYAVIKIKAKQDRVESKAWEKKP